MRDGSGAAREQAHWSQRGPLEGRSRAAASGGSSRWPCQGRRHSPTISSTLRECTRQSPRTNSAAQQASPRACMAAPARASGSGSVPPHGHVHARPRPRPAHSVPEIPADSAKATSGDPEPQRPVGESGSVEWSEGVRGRMGWDHQELWTRGQRWVPGYALLRGPSPTESHRNLGRPQPCSRFSALLQILRLICVPHWDLRIPR